MDASKLDFGQAKVHEYETQIRERHLDTFGHVNNAQYMVLLEEARWEMITSRGYGLAKVHENSVGTVVLECSIRFRKELKLRELIRIRTKIDSATRMMITLSHQILKEDGVVAAEAKFLMGCFDLKERKLISPTSEWISAVTGI